jgi:uncharacterized DUF497 family protein
MIGFAWDPRKAAANVRKHGIHFADAVVVLEDERAITLHEVADDEVRCITIGMDALARVLTIVYTWRDNTVRVISARTATPNEQRQYVENL